jgi:hypothetical protein
MNKPILPREIIQYILAIRSYAYNEHWKQHKIKIATLLYSSLPLYQNEWFSGPPFHLIGYNRNRTRTVEITTEQIDIYTLVIKVTLIYPHTSRYVHKIPIVVVYTHACRLRLPSLY